MMQFKLFFILSLTISICFAGILPDSLQKFGILAQTTVTNSGPSIIGSPSATADIGLYDGSSVTGFPPGILNGAMEITTMTAQLAKADLVIAYGQIANTPCTTTLVDTELGGKTFAPGVYCSATPVTLTGIMYLSSGNSSAQETTGGNNTQTGPVWIFQLAETITTAVSSEVVFLGTAAPCNVFWNIGSAATLGSSSIFQGVMNAYTSISFGTGATLNGKALAQTGAVTLLANILNNCVEFESAPASCFGFNSTDASVCNNRNGTCVNNNTCVCKPGYTGAECKEKTAFSCFGIRSNDTNVCNNGTGVCVSKDKCVCNAGYYGTQCNDFSCFGTVTNTTGVCSGNGTCIGPDTCRCKNGFDGVECHKCKTGYTFIRSFPKCGSGSNKGSNSGSNSGSGSGDDDEDAEGRCSGSETIQFGSLLVIVIAIVQLLM